MEQNVVIVMVGKCMVHHMEQKFVLALSVFFELGLAALVKKDCLKTSILFLVMKTTTFAIIRLQLEI